MLSKLDLLIFPVTLAVRFQADPTAAVRMQEGKAQLERITSDPMARSCWASAVEDLKAGCKAMDDSQRSKLAVKVRARALKTDAHE